MAFPKTPFSLLFTSALLGAFAVGCTSAVGGAGTSAKEDDEGTGGNDGSTGGTGGGTTTAPDPATCAAANAQLTACDLTADQGGYAYLISSEGGCTGGLGTCIATCVAKAACADLQSYPTPPDGGDGEGTCPPDNSPTGTCANACFGPTGFGPSGCYTPLVLSFAGGPVRFERSERAFDLGIGMSVATDWPSAETPWLAIDRNGNGAIDDGTELFGSASPLAGGGRPTDGFAALRELDSNGDGRITPADEAWSRLLVWSDRDGDRVSAPGELAPLESFGVVAIDLDFTRDPRCDARGNCEVERAHFRYRDAVSGEREGTVIDVHLRLRPE